LHKTSCTALQLRMESKDVLQHLPFSSTIDVNFWSQLAALKLDELRLSSEPQPFWASYAPPVKGNREGADPSSTQPAIARFNVPGEAFDAHAVNPARAVRAPGSITILNTLDNFKELDKKQSWTRLEPRSLLQSTLGRRSKTRVSSCSAAASSTRTSRSTNTPTGWASRHSASKAPLYSRLQQELWMASSHLIKSSN